MRFVSRAIQPAVLAACRSFPAVVVTGPRRAGKTTLPRGLFPRAICVLLEDPNIQARARSDPRALLDELRLPALFDEIQNVPELFDYIRTRIDRDPRKMGQWLFTGSQEAPLMQGVTESMDVRAVTNVRDLATFRRFLALLASRHGKILNKTDLAAPLGVSVPTVGDWLHVLEITGQVILVPPYFENFGKRPADPGAGAGCAKRSEGGGLTRFAAGLPTGDFRHAADGRIDMLFRVEGADGEPHGPMDPERSELAVRQRGAVETRAGGDIVVHVQHGSEVRGFQPLEVHGDGGQVIRQAFAAVQAHAGDGARGLSRVDQECHALLPANAANFLDGLNGADHVRAMVHRHQRGVGPDRLGDVAGVDKPGSVEWNEGGFHAAIAHQVMDGADHRIVLEIRGNHVVAGLEQAGNRQVQGIRGVVAERQALGRIFSPEQYISVCNLFPATASLRVETPND
jgi:hypothetical protein